MATQYTSFLGLALPVTGELSGSWGDVVNDSITSLLDSAIAGTTTLSTDGDVTLTTTTGASNQARQAILLCSGARTALRTITAPAQSKIYTVINATTGGFSVKIVGVGPTTGVTIVAGESAVVAWNGSDFIKISNTGGSASFTNVTVSGTTTLSGLTASTALALNSSKEVVSVTNTGTGNNVLSASPTLTGTVAGASLQLSTLTSGRVTYAGASGLLQDSANLTFNGTDLTVSGAVNAGTINATTLDLTNLEVTNIKAKDGTAGMQIANSTGVVSFTANPVISGGTANGVAYLNGSKVLTTGSALTFDGTNLSTTGRVIVSGSAGTSDISLGTYSGGAWLNTPSATVGYLAVGGSNAFRWDASNLVGYIGGSEAMRLTSTGLGIGTSSPAAKLDVTANAVILGYFRGSGGSSNDKRLTFTTGGDRVILDTSNNSTGAATALAFATGGTERMRLSAAGGLSIGTTTDPGAGGLITTGNTTLGDASTDTVTVNGYMGVGGSGAADRALFIRSTALTGVDQIGVYSSATASSSATTALRSFQSQPKTAAAAFTCANIYGFSAEDAVLGAGSSVTNLVGVQIIDQTQGTNNYGLRSLVSSGTNKWNIYASGTAQNYFAGNVGIGVATASEKLQVQGGVLINGTSSSINYTGLVLDYNTSTGEARVAAGGQSGASAFLTFTTTSGGTEAERMRIDASGNVGLGVTPSAWVNYNAIQIPGGAIAGTAPSFRMEMMQNAYYSGSGYNYVATSAATNYRQSLGAHVWYNAPSGTVGNGITFTQAMTLDASGRLLIGTTASKTNAFTSTTAFQVEGTNTGASTASVNKNTADSSAAQIVLGKSRGTANGSFTTVNSGDAIGVLSFQGADGTGLIQAASITGAVDGTPGTNDMPGRLVFSTTADGASSPTERMRIDSSGNVGIGTSSPTSLLAVFKSQTADTAIEVSNNGTANASTTASFILSETPGIPSGWFRRYRDGTARTNIGYATNLTFSSDIGTTPVERMRLDASGNLGVGTTSPTARIHSNGTIQSVTGSTGIQIYGDGGTGYVNSIGAYPLVFQINSTERMRLLSSGELIRGASAGVTSSGGSVLGIETLGGTTAASSIGQYAFATTNAAPFLEMGFSRNATVGSQTVVNSGDVVGAIRFSGSDGTNFVRAAQIVGVVDGTPGTNDMPGRLVFSTSADGSVSPAERMRIDSAGNIQTTTGSQVVWAPAPASISTTATLTNANIQGQIINTTGTSYTVTMPLGSTLETLVSWATTDLGYNFTVISTASGTITMAVNTGVTSLGALTIATGTSAQFRIRRTAANTFILYRMS